MLHWKLTAALFCAGVLSGCIGGPPKAFVPTTTYDEAYSGDAKVTKNRVGTCPDDIRISVSVDNGAGQGTATTPNYNYSVRMWLGKDGRILDGAISTGQVAVIYFNGNFGGGRATGTWEDANKRCAGAFTLTQTGGGAR